MVLFSEHCTKHCKTPLTCLHLSLGGAVVQAAREPPLLLQVSRQPVPASGGHRARLLTAAFVCVGDYHIARDCWIVSVAVVHDVDDVACSVQFTCPVIKNVAASHHLPLHRIGVCIRSKFMRMVIYHES